MSTLPSYNPAPPMGPLPSHNPAPTNYKLEIPGEEQGNSIIEQLLATIKGGENPVTTGLGDAGTVLGSLANDEKSNRVDRGNFEQNHDQLMLNAQTGRNQNEDDALKKLYITNYLKSGGFKGGSSGVQLNGQMRSLPSYGSAPQAASQAQMSSAGTLEGMLQQRLASGGSYMPQDVGSYATPGKVENAGRYGGTIASGLGVINDLMNQKNGQPGVGNNGGNVLSAIGKGAGSVIDKLRNR